MSTIKSSTTSTTAYSVVGDTTGTLVFQTGATPTTAVTIGSDQSVTFAQAANLPNTFGFKNRIINGAMMIDQRNAGASVTVNASSSQTCPDRFTTYAQGSAAYLVQQVPDAPSGFVNSLKLVVTTAATLSAAQFTFTRQIIEGLNIADLAWGSSAASAVSVSFWVKSSLTGTFAVALLNSAEDRSYPATYTINSANTWEQKTITVAGDTTGTWLTNNSNGIRVTFDLGAGSNYNGTANTWQSGWKQRTSGCVSFSQTSGATFYITGVQLEKGSTATSFDYRPYGTELALCQRYCLVYSYTTDGNFRLFGFNFNTGVGLAQCYFPVQTRVAPTGVTTSTASAFTFYQNSSSVAISAIGIDYASNKTGNLSVTATGLTQGGGCILAGQAPGNKIEFTGMEL